MTSSPNEVPISDARDHLAEVVAQATYRGRITYITKRGRRVGAIVPTEVAEAAEHTYLSGLARDAEAELAAGAPTRALSEVIADLDLCRPDDRTDHHADDHAGEAAPRTMPEQRAQPPHPRRRP